MWVLSLISPMCEKYLNGQVLVRVKRSLSFQKSALIRKHRFYRNTFENVEGHLFLCPKERNTLHNTKNAQFLQMA